MTDDPANANVLESDLEAGERASGSRFTAAVYGSILVTTTIASFALADASADRAALFVVVSMLTFWLAHVWSSFVGARVHHGGRVGWTTIRHLGREGWPIAEAGALPAIVLIAHHTGLYSGSRALDIALWACILQLFGWGVAAARRTNASWPFAVLNGAVDAGFGMVIVVLELLVH